MKDERGIQQNRESVNEFCHSFTGVLEKEIHQAVCKTLSKFLSPVNSLALNSLNPAFNLELQHRYLYTQSACLLFLNHFSSA